MGNATGIFNLLRNLGGSFGTAIGTTLLSQRSQFHQNFLVEQVTAFNPFLKAKAWLLNQLIEGKQMLLPTQKTLALLYQQVLAQAQMLAFNDCFLIFSYLTAILIPLVFFMKSAQKITQVTLE